jgi:RNA polymerase II subunit A small phosphatase-like protein
MDLRHRHNSQNSSEAPLAGIITQSRADGSQIVPRLISFKWISALCSCFLPSEGVLRDLKGELSYEALLPPKSSKFDGMKTLVLDLDETLVHSNFSPNPRSEIIVPLELDGTSHYVYVGKRPGVDEFLAHVGLKFEVVIFTASLSKVKANQYADPLIDRLDAYSVVSSRLFRESCAFENGVYIKDLSRLGRDLSQTVIIDVRHKPELSDLLQLPA